MGQLEYFLTQYFLWCSRGFHVRFWTDKLLDDQTPAEGCLSLFTIAVDPKAKVIDFVEMTRGFVVWSPKLCGSLNDDELVILLNLKYVLFKLSISNTDDDHLKWNPSIDGSSL